MVQGGSSAASLSVLLEARLGQIQRIGATRAIEQEAVRIADHRILQRSGLAITNDDLVPFSDYCARRELLWGTVELISHEWSRTRLQGLRNAANSLTAAVSEVGATWIAWVLSLDPKYACRGQLEIVGKGSAAGDPAPAGRTLSVLRTTDGLRSAAGAASRRF